VASGRLEYACVSCRLTAGAHFRIGREWRAVEVITGCAQVGGVAGLISGELHVEDLEDQCPHFGPDVLVVDDWWFSDGKYPDARNLYRSRIPKHTCGIVLADNKHVARDGLTATDEQLLALLVDGDADSSALVKFGPRRPVVDAAGRLEVNRG
jgi:acyl-coenzyme A synthetase/AMP-(fatty) acid ligase